jgi:hypothetical protein
MRAKVLCAALATTLLAGVLAVGTAKPAGAELVVFNTDVNCDSPVGTQVQNVTFSDDAPLTAPSESVFQILFPGGSATLPSTALGGIVTIVSFVNLSTTYSLGGGGTFVPGTVMADGDTTNNGNVVTANVTLGAGNTTIQFSTPGPLSPGDLTTPNRTVDVQAPEAPADVTVHAVQLTTTANIGAPPGTPVPVVCNIPANTLTTTEIVPAGPQLTVDAGPPVTGDVNTDIPLDATVTDPFGTPTLEWTSDNPNCTFDDATAEDTTINCPDVGVFSATLTATDPLAPVSPKSDSTTVTVTSPNGAPVVNAGPDVSFEVDDSTTLNGSVIDLDSTPTILWTIDTPDCSFDDETSPVTDITCSDTGMFAATLTADDGINPPVSDTAVVTVNPPPAGLNVDAGPDVSGTTGVPIALDGKVTDPGPFVFTVEWLSDSPDCTFDDPFAVDTTITCTAPGVFAATLTAEDGVHPDDSDTALVSVSQPNALPVVSAGPDVQGVKETPIFLDGTVTDPDSTPILAWVNDTPGCVFSDPMEEDTDITCPNTGVVAATLIADDGINPPVFDTALVTVLGNAPPVVDAGPDVMTAVGVPVLLNGSVTDPDDTPTAHWATGNPNCTFGDENSAVTTITCTSGGIIAATLTGSDGVSMPVSDTALVTVNAPNTSPTVDAGVDKFGVKNHAVPLDGVVNDPDSSPTIHWATANPSCSFGNPNVAATTITCTATGVFAATLTADDGINEPVSDTALVTFVNPACTGLCVNIGDSMTYEGGAASIPVTLSTPQTADVNVTATIVEVPGGAINGAGQPATFVHDFKTAAVKTVKIRANQRQAFVAVTAKTDALVESDETFQVVLSGPVVVGNPGSGIQLGRSIGIGTIKDTTGLAPGLILAGNTTIVEIDACATCKATAKFSVVLSAPIAAPVSVKYSTVSGLPPLATAPADFTAKLNKTLNYSPGAAIQKAITVMTIGDITPESTERIGINLFNATGATIQNDHPTQDGFMDIIDND